MDELYIQEDLTWRDLKKYSKQQEMECLISYLLYKEGKSIELISRIRNLSTTIIQEHILESKMKLRKKEKLNYHSKFIDLLAADKDNRVKILSELNLNEKASLIAYLKKNLPLIDNADDKMIALWIAGQLKDHQLLPEIKKEINHKHGGVRRMVCSALGRIPDGGNIEVLHRGLQDIKPQVRQYAAKALIEIGDEKTLKKLRNLLNNPKEMDYVKRTYHQVIEVIQLRVM